MKEISDCILRKRVAASKYQAPSGSERRNSPRVVTTNVETNAERHKVQKLLTRYVPLPLNSKNFIRSTVRLNFNVSRPTPGITRPPIEIGLHESCRVGGLVHSVVRYVFVRSPPLWLNL